ncbi:MAG: hypothetical protein PUC39_03940 [Lachnospiraceae bacterium]|nr:hypothetical protein [Lachnospiraceae bacterium]
MKNKVSFYQKFSIFFFVFFIIAVVCCIGSIFLVVKDNDDYKDCKIITTGTLNSCVTQDSGTRTYYFGVYSFSYNNEEWHYVNPTYYTKEKNVPETVSLKHNAFTSKEDMKVKVRYDRYISIPFIYGTIAFFLLVLFIIYNGNYREQKLLLQARSNVKDVDGEIDKELEDISTTESLAKEREEDSAEETSI